MSNNTRLAELMNYITVDTTSGTQLQVSGGIKQTAVTSAILKASSTGVLSAATAGTDYLTSVGISNLTATGTPSSTTYLRGDNTWATIVASGGTVTSVGLSMPSAFTVTSSPITGSGTLTVTGAGTVAQASTFVNSAGTSLAGLAAGSVTGTISSGVLTVPHTSHGLTTGMVVTVTDAALTFTDRAGVAVVGSYTGRITVVNANSFTMDDVTVSGTPTTNGAAYTAVAQPARGTKADLDSKGYTGGTSGNLYEEWKFQFEDLSTVSAQSQMREHSILVNASESDFAALRTAFNNLRGGGTAGSATTANTEADAVS